MGIFLGNSNLAAGSGGGGGGGILREFEITQSGVVELPQEITDGVAANGSHLVQLLMVGGGTTHGIYVPTGIEGGYYPTGGSVNSPYPGGEVVSQPYEITADNWFNDEAGRIWNQIGIANTSEGDVGNTLFAYNNLLENTIDTPVPQNAFGGGTLSTPRNIFTYLLTNPLDTTSTVAGSTDHRVLTALTFSGTSFPAPLANQTDSRPSDTVGADPSQTLTTTVDFATGEITSNFGFGTATPAQFGVGDQAGTVAVAGAITPWFRENSSTAEYSRLIIAADGVVSIQARQITGQNDVIGATVRQYERTEPDYTTIPEEFNYARSYLGASTATLQTAINAGLRSNVFAREGYFGGYGACIPTNGGSSFRPVMRANTGSAGNSGVIKLFY